jgi:hypothetical protein
VHALWAKGFTVPQIARQLHLDAKTLRKYVHAPHTQDLISADTRAADGPGQFGIPEVRSFAPAWQRLRRSTAACLPTVPGAVEGAITRVKAIKTQMYGRANLGVPRKRILLKS